MEQNAENTPPETPHESSDDEQLLRRLAASVVRRAPADAANLLINQPEHIIVAVLNRIDSRISQKILRLLPRETSKTLLGEMGEQAFSQWEINQSYPEDSIGRLMEPVESILTRDTRVSEAIEYIRELSANNIVFTYVYIVDEELKLTGLVVMRDLLFADPDDMLEKVMIEQPFFFKPEKSVKEAMLDVVHRHYPVYPVCDNNGKLIGKVLGYVLFEEHTIEVSAQPGQMVGVDNEEHLATPIARCFRYRHPWLQLNLLTAFMAAFVVGFFEDTIQQVVVLAAFLPVLAGQSGNTGCQALAVTLRGITLGEFKLGLENALLNKELKLGAMNGALVGITAAMGMLIFAYFMNADSMMLLASVVFLAMLASCVASGIAGVLIPVLLRRFGADPVTASTIFLTTATDVISMGMLLGLATLLLI